VIASLDHRLSGFDGDVSADFRLDTRPHLLVHGHRVHWQDTRQILNGPRRIDDGFER